jgi:hypothetical protein
LQECLDALGVKRQLWDREWIPEADLRAVCPDPRELARVLDRISRTEGLLLHLRTTKRGRIFLLEWSVTAQLPFSPPGTCVAGEASGAEHGETGDVDPEPIEDARLFLPTSPPTGHVRLRPCGAGLAPTLESSSCSGAIADLDAATIRRVVEAMGVRVDHVDPAPIVGPAFRRYRVFLESGERYRHLHRRSEDLARELGGDVFVSQVSGERWVALDVPRKDRQVVPLASVMDRFPSANDPSAVWLPIGMSPIGEPLFLDLTLVPHILVAGGTGGGKSVWLRSVLLSLVLRHPTSALRVVLIDGKAVDFNPFASVPHLNAGHIVTEPEDAVDLLRELTSDELVRRTQILQESGCSSLRELRQLRPEMDSPYLVVVVDEFADLAMSLGKPQRTEFERAIVRLGQRARAAGIFLILSTQRPTVEFVTGAIKANLATRVSFRLPSRVDSQVVLDEPGAEGLLGAGDLLLLHEGRLQRLQGYFASTMDASRMLETKFNTSREEEHEVTES